MEPIPPSSNSIGPSQPMVWYHPAHDPELRSGQPAVASHNPSVARHSPRNVVVDGYPDGAYANALDRPHPFRSIVDSHERSLDSAAREHFDDRAQMQPQPQVHVQQQPQVHVQPQQHRGAPAIYYRGGQPSYPVAGSQQTTYQAQPAHSDPNYLQPPPANVSAPGTQAANRPQAREGPHSVAPPTAPPSHFSPSIHVPQGRPLVRVEDTIEWVRPGVLRMTVYFNWSPDAEIGARGPWD
ncbi:hypothetical protein BC834DRAFT_841644 [Gloeopeniophorella convolvens]|nr:hypothetical protein BC834DRAFT_841644 [Gloeopeniophorella convolvens]